MGIYKFVCASVTRNNGIRRAYLTSDEHMGAPGSQPTDVLWNGTADEFVEGATYTVTVTRNLRALSPMEN
jgi:hypothetical protein